MATSHPAAVKSNPPFVNRLEHVPELSTEIRDSLAPVTELHAFRANRYYLDLINWDDSDDPIRKLIIPNREELEDDNVFDPSREADYTVAPGLQHKYKHTALFLANEMCAGFCRFCFRKRLFHQTNSEVPINPDEALDYISRHPEINNVLLSGGDPLLLSTSRLEAIISELRKMEHIHIIRIGTKVPAFYPHRILNDSSLLSMLEKYSSMEKRIYVVVHFNHPRELTRTAIEGLDLLQKSGVILLNQTPLLAGINDSAVVLGELFNKLSFIGVPPYYLFQNRPTRGNKMFRVPLSRGWHIFREALGSVSGLGRRARFTMSHHTGKIELVGVDADRMYMLFHRAADDGSLSRFLVFERDDRAVWLDDLSPADRFTQMELAG